MLFPTCEVGLQVRKYFSFLHGCEFGHLGFFVMKIDYGAGAVFLGPILPVTSRRWIDMEDA